MEKLADRIEQNGFGFCAVELIKSGECAGFCGVEEAFIEDVFPAGTVEIAWRLAPRYWGQAIATEAGLAWLEFGFTNKDFKEIVSFAVHDNHRSIAVMKRLGMAHQPELEFLHPSVPDTHPHLKRHTVYRITNEQWSRNEKRAV